MIGEICAEMDRTRAAVSSVPFPLVYGGGGSRRRDFPPFLRAASAIRLWQGRWAVIQDDVNVIGLAGDGPGRAAEGVR